MAQPRAKLDRILFDLLGTKNVYFQPPPTVRMNYPAIRYSLDNISTKKADNGVYSTMNKYHLTYITRKADDPMVTKLLSLPYCTFSASLALDGLHNYNYTLYF